MDPEDHPTRPLLAPTAEDISEVSVFPLIHRIKQDTIINIDTALNWDQLNAPEVNFSVIKPLVAKYAQLENRAVIYAFLVVRSHFLNSAEGDIAYATLRMARADFCELMAIKLLREFSKLPSKMELVIVLTAGWNALQGAPDQAVKDVRTAVGANEDLEEPISALEVAITTESKHFISSPLVQQVVTEVWNGRVLFSSASNRSLLADNYKARQIATYHDPKGSPFLDHYRLRVPRYRSIIEMFNFCLLLFFFVVCLAYKDFAIAGPTEIVFCIYTFGFILDEFAASQEHGWDVYTANIWNGFDLSFIALFLIYLGLRIRGLVSHDNYFNDFAFDILACAACLLFPRVAFFFISNHVVVVALRAMIIQFAVFIGVAAVCFSGLLFTLWKLSGPEWTFKKIAWLMTQIWFGNTFLSFNVAESFHPIFGPPLMVVYAALSNTLLVTILISILSATYAKIDAHATEEYLYQFAISTLEGVKSDAMFSYQPPFNLAAYLILLPLRLVLSPRMFHTVNVFLIRLTAFPFLAIIGIYERYFAPGSRFSETRKDTTQAIYDSLPRQFKNVAVIEAIVGSTSSDLLDAIFDVELSDDMFGDRNSMIQPSGKSNDGRPQTPVPTSSNGRGRLSAPTSPGFRSQRSRSRNDPQFIIHPPNTNPPSSPLAQLFAGVRAGISSVATPDVFSVPEDMSSSLKRMEGLLEGVSDISSMRAEIKEMKERSERIEALLLSLSRR